MGTTNEKAIAWSEEAKPEPDNISGGDGITRRKSENLGNQQERDYRAGCSESSLFSPGTAVTGGMLDHLIDDHLDQMAAKEDEAERIAREAKRVEADLKRLKVRIQELKALREELKKQSEQNE